MAIRIVSAVTFAVRDMNRSVEFYAKLGFDNMFRADDDSFATMRSDEAYVNLVLTADYRENWWGRAILRVDSADEQYRRVVEAGFEADTPRDAPWGERFFHMRDPDGHELSFAELL